MKRILTILVLSLIAVSASAQMSEKAEMDQITGLNSQLRPVSKPFSLIDLSRVRWSHSYSVSFYSGGSGSASMGMYRGDIFYEFTPSLSVNIGIGVSHTPGAMFDNSIKNNSELYPSVQLDYHPGSNFHLSIGFERSPGFYLDPYRLGYYDYWRR